MRLDNTMFSMYMLCPLKYYERYVYESGNGSLPQMRQTDGVCVLPVLQEGHAAPKPGIELASADRTSLDFGSRFHQLVENQRREILGLAPKTYVPWHDEAIEAEAQATFAGYCGHYVVEPLRFLAAEQTRVVPIPGTEHELIVKLDGVVRHGDGTIGPLDTKTELPRSQSNTPEAWAGRTQATLYLWALSKLYPEERVSRMVVDIVTRGGPKTRPIFRRMDDITRSPEVVEVTLRDLAEVGDDMARDRARGYWRSNMNACKDGWKKCDYFALHVQGRTEANLAKYKPAEVYLEL